jgi:hypothetical protein
MTRKAVSPPAIEDRRILDCLRILVRELCSLSMTSERATGLGAA